MRRIIRDYFTAFRWSKIAETYKSGGWWVFLYFLTVLPAISNFYHTKESALAYLAVTVPILFSMFAAPLHPMALPKIMYLCPMSKDVRREYIVKSCYIRVGFPVVIGLFGVIVLLLNGICDWGWGAGIFFNVMNFSALTGSGMNAKGYGRVLDNGQRTMDMDTNRGLWEALGLFAAFIISLAYAYALAWKTTPLQWVKWVLLGAVLLIQLPITLKYLSFWQESVEQSIFYENRCNLSHR